MTTKFTLTTLSAAIALTLSGGVMNAAMASMNLSDGTGSGGIYASEQNVTGTVTLKPSGNPSTNPDQMATYIVGATLAPDASVWVRVDLPSGVTFADQPTVKARSFKGQDTVGVLMDGVISQGGAGQSSVIFEVAPEETARFKENSDITFTAKGLKVTNKNAVSIQIATFDQMAFATDNSFPLKRSPLRTNWVTFANALTITPGDDYTQTADVSATGGAYFDYESPGTTLPLVEFDYTFNSTYAKHDGTPIKTSDFLDNNSQLQVSGDFSWANVTVAQDSCSTSFPSGSYEVVANSTGATISQVSAGVLAGSDTLLLCAKSKQDRAIPEGTYSGTVTPDAKTDWTVSSGNTSDGRIVHNGTTLRVPFMNFRAGQFAFVQIQNNHPDNAPFDVTCYTYSGQSSGTTLAVPGQTTRAFSAAQMGCPSNTTAVDLVFAVPTGRVNAVMVRQNQADGNSAITGAVGNGLNGEPR